MVKRLFKKQMKTFLIEMLKEYVKTTDNDIDDAIVERISKAMRIGIV